MLSIIISGFYFIALITHTASTQMSSKKGWKLLAAICYAATMVLTVADESASLLVNGMVVVTTIACIVAFLKKGYVFGIYAE